MFAKLGSAAAVVLCVAGCGEKDDSGGNCEPPMGTFVAQFDERDGTCGPISEAVWVFDGTEGEVGENCSGSRKVSEDGCVVQVDVECDAYDDLGRYLGVVSTVGEMERKGSELTGILSIGVADAAGSCSSTYEVSARKR